MDNRRKNSANLGKQDLANSIKKISDFPKLNNNSMRSMLEDNTKAKTYDNEIPTIKNSISGDLFNGRNVNTSVMNNRVNKSLGLKLLGDKQKNMNDYEAVNLPRINSTRDAMKIKAQSSRANE